ncbi:MAG: PASTA domain-containing protein [Fusobacteriaceae bacterium]|jgi:beta-lactam-binding protein with PASTA domain|nr:PASTA domain-containing protein [Fusobacteriaceae bacterium]
MIKRLMYLSAVFTLLISGFFIFKIVEKVYFNEIYYYAPDVRGHSFETVKNELLGEKINVKLVGEEFSQFPVGEIFLQEPEPGQVVKIRRNMRVWVSKGSALVEIPNFVGMNFLEARSIALQKGLIIDKVVSTSTNKSANEVIATDPATDTLLRRGDKLSFLISGTGNFTEIKIPNLIGMLLEDAQEILIDNSLTVGKITYAEQADKYNGIVLETGVLAGVVVKAGTAVTLVVNKSKLIKPVEKVSTNKSDIDSDNASNESDADGSSNDSEEDSRDLLSTEEIED